MSMTMPPAHETILMKYPRTCEKCRAIMTPLYVKMAHKAAPEQVSSTIHYKCDKCGVEYDLTVDLENCPHAYIDPNQGILL